MNSRLALRLALAIGMSAVALAPAAAQDTSDAEIDALIDASATPEGALATARLQAGEGDLTGAAATIERALLVDPDGGSTSLRLYYAALLCRLDDDAGATTQLRALDGRGLGDPVWSEVRAACGGRVYAGPGPGRRQDGVSGEIAAGIAYESDAAGAALVQFDIPGAVVEDDGLVAFGSLQFDGRAGFDGGFVYGSAALVTRNPLSGIADDYQIADLSLGLGAIAGRAEISAGGVLRHALVAGDGFLTELGGAAEIALPAGADGRMALIGQYVDQSYADSVAGFSRDGARFDLALLYQGRIDDRFHFYSSSAFERKAAETDGLGYRAARLSFGLRAPLTEAGVYGTLASTLRFARYDDAAGSPRVSERRYYTRAAIGLPLGSEGMAVEGGVNFSSRDYNQASMFRDYRSVGGELRLVWNFSN